MCYKCTIEAKGYDSNWKCPNCDSYSLRKHQENKSGDKFMRCDACNWAFWKEKK